MLLATLNLTHVLGLLTMGYLSDFVNVFLLLLTSCLGSAIAIFALWVPGAGFISLFMFSITYGFLGGGFEALFPRFVTSLTKDPGAELLFYGVLEFERGLGIVIAGPLSGVIMSMAKADEGAERELYARIGVFIGTTFLIASIGGLGWLWRGTKGVESEEKINYEMMVQLE